MLQTETKKGVARRGLLPLEKVVFSESYAMNYFLKMLFLFSVSSVSIIQFACSVDKQFAVPFGKFSEESFRCFHDSFLAGFCPFPPKMSRILCKNMFAFYFVPFVPHIEHEAAYYVTFCSHGKILVVKLLLFVRF